MVFKTKMNCPFCGGQAVLAKSSLKLFNGIISLPENPIYKCDDCGEEFATGQIAEKTLLRAKKVFSFTRKLILTGGSIGLTFPPDLSNFYKLEKGEKIRLVPKSQKEISILIE